jgi:hypothetical protein
MRSSVQTALPITKVLAKFSFEMFFVCIDNLVGRSACRLNREARYNNRLCLC